MKNYQQTPRQQRQKLELSKRRVANSRKPTSPKVSLEDALYFYQPVQFRGCWW